jgi:hypothetical protein
MTRPARPRGPLPRQNIGPFAGPARGSPRGRDAGGTRAEQPAPQRGPQCRRHPGADVSRRPRVAARSPRPPPGSPSRLFSAAAQLVTTGRRRYLRLAPATGPGRGLPARGGPPDRWSATISSPADPEGVCRALPVRVPVNGMAGHSARERPASSGRLRRGPLAGGPRRSWSTGPAPIVLRPGLARKAFFRPPLPEVTLRIGSSSRWHGESTGGMRWDRYVPVLPARRSARRACERLFARVHTRMAPLWTGGTA